MKNTIKLYLRNHKNPRIKFQKSWEEGGGLPHSLNGFERPLGSRGNRCYYINNIRKIHLFSMFKAIFNEEYFFYD